MKFEKVIFTFEELEHRYCINGSPLTSVSKFIEKFTPEYDKEYWSLYTAIRNKLKLSKSEFSKFLKKNFKYNWQADREFNFLLFKSLAILYNVTDEDVQNVLNEWDKENKKSLDKGTKWHNSQEGSVISNKGKKYKNEFFEYVDFPDLYNLAKDVPVVYPELRMYNEEYGIAGTSDEIYMFPNGDFIVDDWKSNKKIDTENRFTKMLDPISHLDECNYNHYRLQMSIYAWMLEQFGYRCIGTNFTHVELDENDKLIKSTPYIFSPMFKEVKSMLKHFKNKK